MKAVFLFFALLILSGCVSRAVSVSNDNKSVQPAPTVVNFNSQTVGQITYFPYEYDKDLLDKLNAGNEKFRQPPGEFESADFRNFKYDFGRLKEGEIKRYQNNKRDDGTEIYSFEDVFYVDLTGDAKKEAVVFVVRVTCGGSCDGGAWYVYFYSSGNGKPRLIDSLKTGNYAYGCGLKSLTIKNKKINVEQFGRCLKDMKNDPDKKYDCKYCVQDETGSVFSIDKDDLKCESADIFETKPLKLNSTPAFISINE